MTKPKKVKHDCKTHPTFYRTVIESPQWKLWEGEQAGRLHLLTMEHKNPDGGIYDMPEVMECGWISKQHFQDFLKFYSQSQAKPLVECLRLFAHDWDYFDDEIVKIVREYGKKAKEALKTYEEGR